jgi:hypothetical protein
LGKDFKVKSLQRKLNKRLSNSFNSLYSIIFINKNNIHSSLNNLFYKFYNIPKFINYKGIKNYFKNYKIILDYSSGPKKRHNLCKKILHKDTILSIDIKKFIKMYGFR